MYKWLSRLIWQYFGFSKTETNGFIVLMAIVLLLLLMPIIFKFWAQAPQITADGRADSLRARLEHQLQLLQQPDSTPAPFAFNPNKSPYDTLVAVGIPQYLARRIVNYRNKGGHFKQPEDLKRIYDFPDSLYQRLQAYIVLPPPPSTKYTAQYRPRQGFNNQPAYQPTGFDTAASFSTRPRQRWQPKPFDINLTDTASLMAIYGIGPGYSRRIMKYRARLGGFISTDQLAEVWGMPDSTVQAVQALTFVASGYVPQQVSVNTDSVALLGQHPYIPYALAKVMVAYGQQHNGYDSLVQLKNIHIMTDSLFDKMYPYLKL